MRTNLFSRRQFVQTVASTGLVSASGGRVAAAIAAPKQKPALLGGEPVRRTAYPSWPTLEEPDESLFVEALHEKRWCRLGANTTTRFEKKWARELGARYATAVVNGTNAIYGALSSLDVGPGDEVIVPPYTFVATVNAVVQQFALPVFSDTDVETLLMDPETISERTTGDTRCLLPVHLGGSVADMDRIQSVAQKHSLPVVEDACQAHFAEWRGKRVGALGDIGCFSFQATKILPCGEGGAMVTNREDLLNRFHAFQNNGRDRLTGTRDGYLHQGTNLRMTEYQAALLLGQLTRFDRVCRHRESNAEYLTRMLEEVGGVVPAKMYTGCTRNTYYIFMARYQAEEFGGLTRSQFIKAVNQEGIPCGSGYRPLNKEPFLETVLNSRAYRRIYSSPRLKRYREQNECPQNDSCCREGLFFSQRCLLDDRRGVEQIVDAINKIRTFASELSRA